MRVDGVERHGMDGIGTVVMIIFLPFQELQPRPALPIPALASPNATLPQLTPPHPITRHSPPSPPSSPSSRSHNRNHKCGRIASHPPATEAKLAVISAIWSAFIVAPSTAEYWNSMHENSATIQKAQTDISRM